MDDLANRLKTTFDPYFETPLQIWRSFAKQGDQIETSKNEVIKKYGANAKYFYYILNGSDGIMLFNNNNYLCLDLCYEGNFFGDYLSFLTNQKTEIEVICFEPNTLFRINKTNFNTLSQTD